MWETYSLCSESEVQTLVSTPVVVIETTLIVIIANDDDSR